MVCWTNKHEKKPLVGVLSKRCSFFLVDVDIFKRFSCVRRTAQNARAKIFYHSSTFIFKEQVNAPTHLMVNENGK